MRGLKDSGGLRGAIQQVLGQLAARPQPKLPAMQGIALLALERRREEAQLHRSLVADEFYDAKEAIAQFQVVRTIGKGQYGEVMIGFHAPTRKTYAMKRQKSSGNSPGSGTLRKRDMAGVDESSYRSAAYANPDRSRSSGFVQTPPI